MLTTSILKNSLQKKQGKSIPLRLLYTAGFIGLLTLTSCTMNKGMIGQELTTNITLNRDNFTVVDSVSSTVKASSFLGIFGSSEQDLYRQAREKMVKQAQLIGQNKALINLTADTTYQNYILVTNRRVTLSADVVAFKESPELGKLKLALAEAKKKQTDTAEELRKHLKQEHQQQASLIRLHSIKKKLKQDLENKAAKIATLQKKSNTYQTLSKQLKQEIAAGKIKFSEQKGKLKVYLPNKVLFDSGKTILMSEGRKILAKVSEIIGKITNQDIRIEGHTDSDKISGSLARIYPTNWELSTARATMVVRYLVEKTGIDPHNIYAVGFGEFQPVASNDTPEGKARNRRISIALLPKK